MQDGTHPTPPSQAPDRVGGSTKAQIKALSSAGHLAERFATACDALQARVQDGRFALPSPWREAISASGSCALTGDGLFALEFGFSKEGALRMQPRLLSAEAADVASLIAKGKAEHPEVVGEPLLAAPPALNAPWCLALLRLRQLRDFWERELRRNGLEQLLALLPDAWLLDPAPLPPGAVIPRLELGAWEELATARADDCGFSIHRAIDVGETAPAVWQDRLREALVAFPAALSILTETDVVDATRRLNVIYLRKAPRVDMVTFAVKDATD